LKNLILKQIKENKKYEFIFLIYIFLMFICIIFDSNILYIIYKYISDMEYRNNIMDFYNVYDFMKCLIKFLFDTISNLEWHFDYIVIWGTNIFQISLPFLAVVGFSKFKTKYTKKIKRDAIIEAIKISTATFLAYLLFFTIVIIICKGKCSTYITREFLIDIFGKSFYFEHIYLYYIIDGFIRFFFMSFIYAYSGGLLSLSYNKKSEIKNLVCYYFITIYFALSIISTILIYTIGNAAIYFGPQTIMIAGTYFNINSILIIAINLIPLVICLTIFHIRKGNHET